MNCSPPRSPARARRGSALVLALGVVIILSSLGAAFLVVTRTASKRQGSETQHLQAFYLAEAGLAESFQALRIGRSGQVGSEASPAEYGDGLLWVDATATADDQVRLTSTALYGSGRASLALVVEPVDTPLGFFSDEELVVDSVLLVDGFDSGEATYEEEIVALFSLRDYALDLAAIVGRDVVDKYLSVDDPRAAQQLAVMAAFDEQQTAELVSIHPDLHAAYIAGTLFPESVLAPTFGTGTVVLSPDYVAIDSDAAALDSDPLLVTDSTMEPTSGAVSTSETTVSPTALPTEYTDSGGMISSNGSIIFSAASAGQVAIQGDVVPGPDGVVQGLTEGSVTGNTQPRTTLVDLPAVEVPTVAMAAAVRHEDLLPMLVSPGTSGHAGIEVAADAELILRGPATVVIGTLVLEPGAVLTLDTRDGPVELYVTGGMDLQEGSVVTTSSDYPDELTIQVDAIPTGPDGAPVKLDATSQFHGTIYAPETEVHVGTYFEVFGGIVARKLDIGPGARLHFDNTEYEGSPIPRLVAWRIMEIPASVRNNLGNPYSVLGVAPGDPLTLSEAHDLASVELNLTYEDASGAERSYAGTEDQFDWSLVAKVLKVERESASTTSDPTDTTTVDPVEPEDPLAPDEIAPGVRIVVHAAISGYPSLMNAKDLVDLLIPLSPLSPEEWSKVDATGLAGGQYDRLVGAQ